MNSSDIALTELLPEEHRVADLQGLSADRIVRELLESIAPSAGFDADAVDTMTKAILGREREATTGIGNGVAIPHMKGCSFTDRIVGAVGRSAEGVEWGAPDGQPARLFFLILTPAGLETEHVQAMKKIVRLSRDKKSVDFLVSTKNFDAVHGILQEVDAEV